MAAGSDPCMTVRITITLLPERDFFTRQTVHSPSRLQPPFLYVPRYSRGLGSCSRDEARRWATPDGQAFRHPLSFARLLSESNSPAQAIKYKLKKYLASVTIYHHGCARLAHSNAYKALSRGRCASVIALVFPRCRGTFTWANQTLRWLICLDYASRTFWWRPVAISGLLLVSSCVPFQPYR